MHLKAGGMTPSKKIKTYSDQKFLYIIPNLFLENGGQFISFLSQSYIYRVTIHMI